MRNGIIPPLVKALRENGRTVDAKYMRYLETMPILQLERMFERWTQAQYVY